MEEIVTLKTNNLVASRYPFFSGKKDHNLVIRFTIVLASSQIKIKLVKKITKMQIMDLVPAGILTIRNFNIE